MILKVDCNKRRRRRRRRSKFEELPSQGIEQPPAGKVRALTTTPRRIV